MAISFICRVQGTDVEGLKFEPFVRRVSHELRRLRQELESRDHLTARTMGRGSGAISSRISCRSRKLNSGNVSKLRYRRSAPPLRNLKRNRFQLVSSGT